MVAIALAIIGLGFGVLGTGAMLGWWISDEPELARASAAEEPKAEVAELPIAEQSKVDVPIADPPKGAGVREAAPSVAKVIVPSPAGLHA